MKKVVCSLNYGKDFHNVYWKFLPGSFRMQTSANDGIAAVVFSKTFEGTGHTSIQSEL